MISARGAPAIGTWRVVARLAARPAAVRHVGRRELLSTSGPVPCAEPKRARVGGAVAVPNAVGAIQIELTGRGHEVRVAGIDAGESRCMCRSPNSYPRCSRSVRDSIPFSNYWPENRLPLEPERVARCAESDSMARAATFCAPVSATGSRSPTAQLALLNWPPGCRDRAQPGGVRNAGGQAVTVEMVDAPS